MAGGAAVVGGWSDYAFPINKSLWTGSYVLFSAGLACLVLALMYWLVDIEVTGDGGTVSGLRD